MAWVLVPGEEGCLMALHGERRPTPPAAAAMALAAARRPWRRRLGATGLCIAVGCTAALGLLVPAAPRDVPRPGQQLGAFAPPRRPQLSAVGGAAGNLQLAERFPSQAAGGRSGLVARRAVPVEVEAENTRERDKPDEPHEISSFLALNVDGLTVNSSWQFVEERGDINTYFQIDVGPTTAKFSTHESGGAGWNLASHKFDIGLRTISYVVDNPYGISTTDDALPVGQVSKAFNPVLKDVNVASSELLKILEPYIADKKKWCWEGFKKCWEKYL